MIACLHCQPCGKRKSISERTRSSHYTVSLASLSRSDNGLGRTFIVDYMTGLLEVDRVDHFIIPIILISSRVSSLTTMSRANAGQH